MNNEWYRIANISEVDSPALIIYPERVKENIARLKAMVPDVNRLRPHVKTHKSPDVTRLMLEAGITMFKCATIAEAEMLALENAPDVLLAHQPVGPKAARLANLVKQYPHTTFSCLVDNKTTALELDAVFSKAGHQLATYLDLNIGMNRTGIKPGIEAEELYLFCQQLKGIRAIGLHAYDGHLRDPDLAVRTKQCNEGFKPVTTLKESIQQKGAGNPIIIAGGSPSFPIHAKRNDVICSPGTFIYWDWGYKHTLQEQPFDYAALVVSRVVSLPANGIVCIDLGHKSIASENTLDKRVFFFNAPELEPIGHSEEHMVFKTNTGHSLQVGDVLYGVPYHVCPTCALHDTAVAVTNGTATGLWNISARKRKLTN